MREDGVKRSCIYMVNFYFNSNSIHSHAPRAHKPETLSIIHKVMKRGWGRTVAGEALASVLVAGWLRFLPLVDFFLRSSVLGGAAPGLSVLGGSGAFFSGSSRVGAGGSSSSGGSGSGSR